MAIELFRSYYAYCRSNNKKPLAIKDNSTKLTIKQLEMTKKQFIKNLNTLIQTVELEKESMRLFESGGIDPNKFDNDMLLPKIILYVALQNEAEQYRPLSSTYYSRTIANLKHF